MFIVACLFFNYRFCLPHLKFLGPEMLQIRVCFAFRFVGAILLPFLLVCILSRLTGLCTQCLTQVVRLTACFLVEPSCLPLILTSYTNIFLKHRQGLPLIQNPKFIKAIASHLLRDYLNLCILLPSDSLTSKCLHSLSIIYLSSWCSLVSTQFIQQTFAEHFLCAMHNFKHFRCFHATCKQVLSRLVQQQLVCSRLKGVSCEEYKDFK